MLLCCLLNFYKFVFLFYAFFAISKSITWRSLVATFTYHTRNKATMKLVPRKGKLMSWEIRDEIFRDIVRYSWEISEKIKWKLSISHPPSTYASKKWDFFFFDYWPFIFAPPNAHRSIRRDIDSVKIKKKIQEQSTDGESTSTTTFRWHRCHSGCPSGRLFEYDTTTVPGGGGGLPEHNGTTTTTTAAAGALASSDLVLIRIVTGTDVVPE